MVLRVNEDRVVRTGSHAGFAADADRFIEINDAVGAFEHRGGGAGGGARRMRALITARDLVGAARLRKYPDVHMLDVGPGDADWNDVFRFACSGARVTADTTRVVDYLRPLHALVVTWLFVDHAAEA